MSVGIQQDSVVVTPTCSAGERRSWAGLARVHAQLSRLLDARMQADHGYSATHFEVVAALADSGGR